MPFHSVAADVEVSGLVALSDAMQGLFTPSPTGLRIATALDLDGRAARRLGHLRDARGTSPLWASTPTGRVLVLLDSKDNQQVLEGSPAPFASDPRAKRKGMSHFQPNALTLSRGEYWYDRRQFTEAVLDTGQPWHRLGSHFSEVVQFEVQRMLNGAPGLISWPTWHAAFRKSAARVILGDAAADDDLLFNRLTRLMREANRLRGKPSPLFPQFMAQLSGYVSDAAPLSLTSLFAAAPSSDITDPAGQVPHWLFAMGDTLAINAFRALGLLATHPRHLEAALADNATRPGRYLTACLQEAMRLWPSTRVLGREAIEETVIADTAVPAGTQILIPNVVNHRNPPGEQPANDFRPELWLGPASEGFHDWSFNQLSNGPQRCPGVDLALLIGSEALRAVINRVNVALVGARLTPGEPLPHMFDALRARFTLA